MSETSFYQHFRMKRLSRWMTRIKEKRYFLGRNRPSLLLETRTATTIESENTSEIIKDVNEREPKIEYPSLPSLPPPPRYHRPHLNAHKQPIQTRSSFIATPKPCLYRSNTLGHPTTSNTTTPSFTAPDCPSPPPPISTSEIVTMNHFKVQDNDSDDLSLFPRKKLIHLPSLEIYTNNDSDISDQDKQTGYDSPSNISRTPSLINFPNSSSSSISRM